MPRRKPFDRVKLFDLAGATDAEKGTFNAEKNVWVGGLSASALAIKAFQLGRITDQECKDMDACSVTTIKRHLHTMVKDVGLRDAIDRYVRTYSQIACVGSLVFNAFGTWAVETGLSSVPKWLEATYLDATVMKYVFMPFKSELTGSRATCKSPDFVEFWDQHGDLFRPMYPPNDEIMRALSAWDQPLNKMSQEAATAFDTHVRLHFPARFKKWITLRIQRDLGFMPGSRTIDGVRRKTMFSRIGVKLLVAKDGRVRLKTSELGPFFFTAKLMTLIAKGTEKFDYQEDADVENTDIPESVTHLVQESRDSVGLEPGAFLEGVKTRKLDSRVLHVHVEMARYFEAHGDKSFSFAPINDMRRRFCYIDTRIADDLLEAATAAKHGQKPSQKKRKRSDDVPAAPVSNPTSTLVRVFGLTREAWKAIGMDVRRKIRKNARSRKKKRRRGVGTFPARCMVSSVSTDGVGLSVHFYRLPKTLKSEADEVRARELADRLPKHVIGFDDGRVNLFQAAQYDASSEYQATRLTAKSYQRRALITRLDAEEKAVRQRHPELATAYAEMSTTPWKTTRLDGFLAACSTFAAHRVTLVTHHVDDVGPARRRMLTWRRKTAVMAQSYFATIRKCYTVPQMKGKVQLVMAVGDANVKPTGRRGAETTRHGAVPTTWKHKVLERVLRSTGIAFKIAMIDEFRTTVCCHACGSRMKDHYDEEGKVVRGLKRCTKCATETSFKLRNRDGNAARNIWRIGHNAEHGLERPEHLCRQPRRIVLVRSRSDRNVL